jgi:hypothetical protein
LFGFAEAFSFENHGTGLLPIEDSVLKLLLLTIIVIVRSKSLENLDRLARMARRTRG